MISSLVPPKNAVLLLADGSEFWGYGIGKEGNTAGELCFNTAMTGYQEILTDPSYTSQLICFTFPHIGNVGANAEDIESAPAAKGAAGLILREPITNPSNFRSAAHFNDWLISHELTGISGIDTRALTRHIRLKGAQNGAIAYRTNGKESDAARKDKIRQLAQKALEEAPDMSGLELAAHVTLQQPKAWQQQRWELGTGYPMLNADNKALPHVVAIDYGVKHNILRSLATAGCRITVLPATSSTEDVLALNPDGVFLSNGPGDPAATANYAVPVIKEIVERGIPTFGICLGHQMLGLALGCGTEKMTQGHRGANHPVKDLQTGKVEITSQNHGFCVSDRDLPADIEVTHRSLFDGTIQGIRHKTLPAFSVQGHPEASPGPHDSAYLFTRFLEMIQKQKKKAA